MLLNMRRSPDIPVSAGSLSVPVGGGGAIRPDKPADAGSLLATRETWLWNFVAALAVVANLALLAAIAAALTSVGALGPTILTGPVFIYVGLYYGMRYVLRAIEQITDAYASPYARLGVARGSPSSSSLALVDAARVQPGIHVFKTFVAYLAAVFCGVYLAVEIKLLASDCPAPATPVLAEICTSGYGVVVGSVVIGSVLLALQLCVAIIETVITASLGGSHTERRESSRTPARMSPGNP
jgi:hypothetical protein